MNQRRVCLRAWTLIAQHGQTTGSVDVTGATGTTGLTGAAGAATSNRGDGAGDCRERCVERRQGISRRRSGDLRRLSYTVLINGNTDPVTDAASWSLLAPARANGATHRGADGATGTMGSTGATGATGAAGRPGLTWSGTWAWNGSLETNDVVKIREQPGSRSWWNDHAE